MSGDVFVFEWTRDLTFIGREVGVMKRNMMDALQKLGDIVLGQMLDYAKTKAPWTDRTGHARQGLSGMATASRALLIVIYHTMDYGVWLEFKAGGRWGILLKTVEAFVPRIVAMLRGLFLGAA